MMPVTEYPEMKDSGTQWLGEIPSSWNVCRIAALYSVRNEHVSDRDYAPLSVTMAGIVPQLETAAKTKNGDDRKLVRKGDFAINSRSDRRGSCGVSEYDGSVSLINTVLAPRDAMHSGYYNWLFHTVQFADEFYRCGHGIVDDLWSTGWREMKKIPVPEPTLQEQNEISDYLDSRCAQIDSMIATAKANIEDYKALKQSVITQAVTKGLDSNVEMKDSGIEWIGKIEKDFTVVRLKHLLASPLQYGANESGLPYDETLPRYIRITDIAMNGYSLKNEGKLSLSNEAAKGYLLENNDVLLARSGASAGKSFIYKALIGCAAFAGYLIRCRIDTMKALPEYIAYYTKSSIYEIWKSASYIQATIPNISAERYNNLPVTVPPLNKQYEIIQYLEIHCAQIDQLISEQQALIDDLEVAKKSLIFECVTGKRRVI